MSAIFANVLPVFILILVGWLLLATGYLKADVGQAMGAFVFKVAVPVLLFTAIGRADFDPGAAFRLWGAYFSGIAIAWIAGQLISARVFHRDPKASVVMAFSSCFSNLVLIGLPLISRTFGSEGLLVISTLLAVHLPTMMTISTVMIEFQESRDGTHHPLSEILVQISKSLVRNPMIIAILSGAVVNLLGIHLPDAVMSVTDQLAHIAGPMALVSLGMSLRQYGVSGSLAPAFAASGLKLVLMPAAVFLTSRLFDLPPVWAMTAVLCASIPPGVNVWLIANQFNSDRRFAASVITLGTALGVITVSAWAALIGVGT
ncbi:AEC family transporter [Rhizobium sp. L1K21]|uniref:AEC family transporter n=1 Tax=Rhizobium sp. L1K21 TaxID=2954933 RepID=UPI002093749F|nr:AEC family transporter [Rhizobium sp. L1K21]MCO6187441.1 AEC family transporter [Rhizobium sp. L1K21]